MAKQIQVTYTSDLSGAEGAETVQLRLNVDIDLTTDEKAEVLAFLAPYRMKGRKPGQDSPELKTPKTGTTGAVTVRADRKHHAEMRAWLRANGYSLGDKGRIPNDMQRAYAEQATRPELPVRRSMAVRAAQPAAEIQEPESTSTVVAKAVAKATQKPVRTAKAAPVKAAKAAPAKAPVKAAKAPSKILRAVQEPEATVLPMKTTRRRASQQVPALDFSAAQRA